MTAIYYHPEAYTTSNPKLMGRNVAGESFLRGFLSHSTSSEFWAQVHRPEHYLDFASAVASSGRLEPVRYVNNTSLSALSQTGVLYYPGPGIGKQAFQRSDFGHNAWSLCGITHTTSSVAAMDDLGNLITAPVQPWDAVICTSTSVKDNVTRLLQAQVDYLQSRLGVSRIVLPQLPVIPLGIHTADFVYTAEQKINARASLGVSADTLVVLFMGRLSFHAKAHPLAMYQALESATKATGKSVVLVECGWHANEFIEKAYTDAAQLACPSVRVITLDGRKAEGRETAWAGADIFCSLSDNIQETFGIVPIEAMAAGLPVVVSDWDGYKDTVRDGVDGFRIPTLMPEAGMGRDLAMRHALEIDTYDMYCGHTCSLVAVDVQATIAAFIKLFSSADLRHQMGEAGRMRSVEEYDWKNIIGRYEALWAKQTELRLSAKAESSKNYLKHLTHPWPSRMDPFHAFANYPTQNLTTLTRLSLVDVEADAAINRAMAYRKLAMVDFAKAILPTELEIQSVLKAAQSPCTASALIEGMAQERRPIVFRGLVWLVKMNVLKVCL